MPGIRKSKDTSRNLKIDAAHIVPYLQDLSNHGTGSKEEATDSEDEDTTIPDKTHAQDALASYPTLAAVPELTHP